MGKAALVKIVVGLMLGAFLMGCAGNSSSDGPQNLSSTSVRSEVTAAPSVVGTVSGRSDGSAGMTDAKEVAESGTTGISVGPLDASPKSEIEGRGGENQTGLLDPSSPVEAQAVSEATGETGSADARQPEKRRGKEKVLSREHGANSKSGDSSGAAPLSSVSGRLSEEKDKQEGRSQQGGTGDGFATAQPSGLDSRRRPSAEDLSLEQDNSLYTSQPDVSQAVSEGTGKTGSRGTHRAQKRVGEEEGTSYTPVVDSDDAPYAEPVAKASRGTTEEIDEENNNKGDHSPKDDVGVRSVADQIASSDEHQGAPADDLYLDKTTVAPAVQGEKSSRLSGPKNGVPPKGMPRPAELQRGGRKERRAKDKWNLDWRRPRGLED